jgi:DNA-binding NarL/FixJ family response regulator
MPAKPVRVFIVSDHPLVREGLRSLIEKERKFVFCGLANDYSGAPLQIKRSRAQIVILTGHFVGAVIRTLEQIQALQPPVSTVFVSMRDDSADAAFALRAGVKAFLTKSTSAQVVDALTRVAAGEIFVAGAGSADLRKTDLLARADELLSERELQVFALIGEGLTNSAIAQRLGVSVKTLDTHRDRAKEKLGFKHAFELRRAAFRWSDSVSRS